MPNDYRSAVRSFIQSNFVLGADIILSDEDSLLDLQIVDSTGFLELVGFLEQQYAIRIGDDEMVPENLESIANIDRYLQRKIG